MAEREAMELLAEFFHALNEEVAKAGVQKKQLATLLGLSPSSVSEMFSSGKGGNKTPPTWERVDRILRFCWDRRGSRESPGVASEVAARAFKAGQVRRLEGWKLRHAMLVRDIERARDGTATTSLLDVHVPIPEMRYSLPPDTASFTGRGNELGQIMTVPSGAAGAGGVVAVAAVDGMPGVGKTALAVHAAHLLRSDYPDRQLFINLHAYTPGREPVRPEDALAGLLTATGVDQAGDGQEGLVEVLSSSEVSLEGTPLLVLGVGVLYADAFR